MKTNKLIDAIGNIDDHYVEEAHKTKERSRFAISWPTVRKVAVAFGCFLLAVTLLPNMFSHANSADKSDSGGGTYYDNSMYYEGMNSGTSSYKPSYDAPSAMVSDEEASYMAEPGDSSYSNNYSNTNNGTNSEPDLVTSDKKMIVSANMSAETQDLDATIANLTSQVSAYEGYIQRSSTYTRGSTRVYEATYRIPAAKYQAFLESIQDAGNVLNYFEETEDITNTYTDIEARLNTLKAQEERVMELYKQAESIEDLMNIEERLSDLRYQIEYYEAQIRNYDLLVAYSTLSISVSETKVYTPTSTSFLTRLGNAFRNGWQNCLDNVGDFLIDVVYNIWTILFLAVLGFVGYRVYRHIRNKRNG
ncbi:MAG: DUF4349 domain-containing protein [Erysipelotrichaceae bacterium]|nr:DUF4349 domain-containing protein [Erysipelotrichaceae bacterium]